MSVALVIIIGVGIVGLVLLPLDFVTVLCLLFSRKGSPSNTGDSTEFEGKVGTVAVGFSSTVSGSSGRVEISGTTWPAELAHDSENAPKEGDSVSIVGRRGLTLLVSPTDAT